MKGGREGKEGGNEGGLCRLNCLVRCRPKLLPARRAVIEVRANQWGR